MFNFSLQPDQSDEQTYIDIIQQAKVLLDKEEHVVTNLANLSALLKQSFKKISWVGFYLYDGSRLILGPFQGKVACTSIVLGKGVCGTAAQKQETVIVPDVHAFPGHIACDGNSSSEIVVPLLKSGKLLGVLDLDSYHMSAFNENDKIYLEELMEFLCEKIIQTNTLL